MFCFIPSHCYKDDLFERVVSVESFEPDENGIVPDRSSSNQSLVHHNSMVVMVGTREHSTCCEYAIRSERASV